MGYSVLRRVGDEFNASAMTLRPEWRGGGGGGGGCDIRLEEVDNGGSDSVWDRGIGVDVLSMEMTDVSESFRLGLGKGGFEGSVGGGGWSLRIEEVRSGFGRVDVDVEGDRLGAGGAGGSVLFVPGGSIFSMVKGCC